MLDPSVVTRLSIFWPVLVVNIIVAGKGGSMPEQLVECGGHLDSYVKPSSFMLSRYMTTCPFSFEGHWQCWEDGPHGAFM